VACAIHTERGHAGTARELAADLEGSTVGRGVAAWARAGVHRLLGELDQAAALLEAAWEANQASGRRADAATLLGARVAIGLDRDDRSDAATWAVALATAIGEDAGPVSNTIRDRSTAASTGDPGAAHRALVVAEDHGLALEAAAAHLVLGQLGDEPSLHLEAAFEAARDLGAETLRRRVARAMKEAGIEPPRAPRVAKGDLTDTERRLAQLVHDGLTNREIASVLIVSPKTVEVYLSRLFAKSGCESRVELAVAVSEGRLTP
jgi:DNA-binding CsgD family transcriptional regulator